MGVATGIAFDDEENLYVGDRSGTIFKISRERQIYVFATLEPSIAAYHLAFGPDEYLYVTGPTTSSFDSVYRISPAGDVEVFYRGLGRPQGLAFDVDGNLYVAASLGGRRGVVRINPDRKAGTVPLRSGHRGSGLRALEVDRRRHHQRALSRRRGHRGQAARLTGRIMAEAEIIAVGSELLRPTRSIPTRCFSPQLNDIGVEVVRKIVVGDDRARLAESVRSAASVRRS